MPVQADGGKSDASARVAAHLQQPTLSLSHANAVPVPVPVPEFLRASLELDKTTAWNTRNLGLRLGADAASAAAAGLLVAPVVCAIDRSIIEKASTGSSFKSCFFRALRPIVTRPDKFIVSKPFLLIFTLYFGTYLTANAVDTATSTVKAKPASHVTSGTSKFGATSAVNMSLCVYKDSQFVKLFGGGAGKSPAAAAAAKIPLLSYALFAMRDSMTIFASFNLPPLIAPRLLDLPEPVKKNLSMLLSTESRRTNTAQFFAPAAMQLISTPVHLLGLDLYNRQGGVTVRQRCARIGRDWGVSALARMCRIIPAFGVGGVVNSNVRKGLMTTLE